MENKQRSYEEFEPTSKWRKEEDQVILELHLEGFKKEQLRIRIASAGVLTISGECPLDETKSRRFCKSVNFPRDCRKDGVHAKFSGGILTITLQKKQQRKGYRTEQTIDPNKQSSDQATTSTGIAALTRTKARKCITALRDSSLSFKMGRNKARRLGAAIGVVVAVTVGAYVAYLIRQSFHF